MLTKLSIQHYRSIQGLDLTPAHVNVLVGPNSAGKSNLIDAVKFIRDALENGLDQAITERHGLNSIRQWAPTRPYNISISVNLGPSGASDSGRGHFSFRLGSRGDEYVILSEEGSWSEVQRVRRHSRPGSDEAPSIRNVHRHSSYTRDKFGKVTLRDSRDDRPQVLEIDNIDDFFLNSRFSFELFRLREQLTNFQSYSIFPNTLRQAQKPSNELYLSSHGDNLTSVLKRMRNKKRTTAISEIIASMKLVIPNLENITIQSVGGFLAPQFRLAETNEESRSYTFNVNQMSDGTLRILGLLVALYQDPRPRVMALEEPELTVHPGMLQLIADSIMEVSESTQVFVTTHSPDLIDRFDPSQIIAVELKDGITTARELDFAQVKAVKEKLFTLGELMSVEGLHG
jgi:predicted ATPase